MNWPARMNAILRPRGHVFYGWYIVAVAVLEARQAQTSYGEVERVLGTIGNAEGRGG